MTTSNRLGITELAETQNNRSVTVNEAIAKLEAGAMFFPAVQVSLNAAPGSPVEGDVYVVGTAGTGAFSGHNAQVAVFYNAAWLFFTPIEGMFAWDQTSNSLKYYNGTAWAAFTVGSGSIADADYGDVTVSAGVWTIDNDVVTNAKAANMAQSTIKGRAVSAGTGDPTDLTATQATAILDAVVGDSGAGGTKGLVPAPAAGDAAAGKFLKADGTFAVPAGTGVATSRQIISGAGLTGGGDLSADRTLAVGAGTGIVANADDVAIDKASDANVRASASNKVLTADLVESASALVALTDGANIAVDWDAAINFSLTIGGNRTLDNPTNGQPGTWRTVIITQDGTGTRTLAYGNQYKFPGGTEPVLTTAAGSVDILNILCVTTSNFYVFSAADIKQ